MLGNSALLLKGKAGALVQGPENKVEQDEANGGAGVVATPAVAPCRGSVLMEQRRRGLSEEDGGTAHGGSRRHHLECTSWRHEGEVEHCIMTQMVGAGRGALGRHAGARPGAPVVAR